MTRRRRWLIGLAVLVMAQLAVVSLYQRIRSERERPALPVRVERHNEPARDLYVETHDGDSLVVAAQSDRFQLVHFWATWCPPCRDELPILFDMANRNRDWLTVWAVTTDPEWATVERFLDGEVPKIVVRDPHGATARTYGVSDLPDSYLIDPHGVIRARFSGAQDWAGREMRGILDDARGS